MFDLVLVLFVQYRKLLRNAERSAALEFYFTCIRIVLLHGSPVFFPSRNKVKMKLEAPSHYLKI